MRKKIPRPPDTSTHIYFRSIVSDTQKLDNRTTYLMFSDTNEYCDERAITIPEQELMKWFFNNPLAVELIWEELDLPENYIWSLEVRDPIIKSSAQKPGDIDCILCHKNDPRNTIAFEAKRIKIKFDDSKHPTINKTQSLHKGVEQANALSKLGFYKVYLFVMIITDGYELKGEDQIFKRAPTTLLNNIYNFPGFKNLESNVGIILCPITQLSGKPIDQNNMISIREHLQAIPREQPGDLNDDIVTFLKRKKACI